MYQMLSLLIENISNFMYSYLLIIMLLAVGLYFTIRTKFVQQQLWIALDVLKDYSEQRIAGKDPQFKAASIGLKEKTDFWK